MKTAKITIWGIARKITECHGHGEYIEELSIRNEDGLEADWVEIKEDEG